MRLLIAVFCVALLWMAPAQAQTTLPRAEPLARCPFQPPPGMTVGEDIECGYLIVAEDRADPASPTIRLLYSILRHPDGDPEPDPIVYLEGGPGGSRLEFLALSYPILFRPFWGANRDIIILDQRGVGFSEPALDCPQFSQLSLELLDYEADGRVYTNETYAEPLAQALSDCAQTLAAEHNLSAYNTAANAADINDLRMALGYEQVNLWGISYGTRLALGVLRDYPQGVRSVVLDSVYTPDVDLIAEVPANFDRALRELFAACAMDSACDAAYPNLEAVLFATVAALESSPLELRATHFFTGRGYPLVLDGEAFLSLLFQALYSTELIGQLPRIIYEAAAGRAGDLQLIASNIISQQSAISIGMNLSVICQEEVPYSDRAQFLAYLDLRPQWATMLENSLGGGLNYRVCASWPSGVAPLSESQPITSDVPALVIAGQFDPITPPLWAERAAQGLSRSYYYELPGAGHGASLAGACPQGLVMQFWADPTTAPNAGCIGDMGVVFAVPADAAAAAPPPTLVETDVPLYNVRLLLPAGWTEIAPGAYGRMENGLDQTALAVISMPGSLDTDAFIGLVAGALGAQDPQRLRDVAAGGREWALYAVTVQGFPARMALAQAEGRVFVLLLLAGEAEIDALTESVLLPAIESLTVTAP